VKLIRCSGCRYSFERVDDDARCECPQCGAVLAAGEPEPATEALEDRKTRKIHIISKLKDE
jgi:hypothetical protein